MRAPTAPAAPRKRPPPSSSLSSTDRAPPRAAPSRWPRWLAPLTGPDSRSGAESASATTGQDSQMVEADPFVRLWQGFMTARVIVALALLGIVMLGRMGGPPFAPPKWLIWLCGAHLLLTLIVRLRAQPTRPGRAFDPQWVLTIGVDLLVIALVQLVYTHTSLTFIPLFVLPVLLAAVLGSRMLALGTAAAVTLLLLADTAQAWWRDVPLPTNDFVQAGLTGAGLLLVALLANQLSARLARAQKIAQRSLTEAQVQMQVNARIIESLSDGVLVIDAHLGVRSANPAARTLLGCEALGTPAQFSLHDAPVWRPLVELAQHSFASGDVPKADVVLRHSPVHPFHLMVHTELTPAPDSPQRSLCVMFLQDLREHEARLRTEKLAAMGRMSAAVAHEIRNPLAAIAQANALLDEELTDPHHQRLSAMVRQNAARLGHIVDDVLDVARVEPRGSAEGGETLSLNAHVAVIARDWSQQHAMGARLKLGLRAAAVEVYFNPDHLRRILVNLLDNARRYATGQDAAIQIHTQGQPGTPMLLTIWSDGPPIDPSVERHLFEPFFSSESRSSGLGLYICRELCERHGAVIAYERTQRPRAGPPPVEGNEFFISLRPVPVTPRPSDLLSLS